jgi:two-component system sensor histidine kinase KdpD
LKHVKDLFIFNSRKEANWRRYGADTLLGAISALLITGFIYAFQLYPRIPNISLLYVLVVLGLASTRGRYPAIICSVVAFFAFNFFLVQPLYTFAIAQFDEWLALFILLVTAIITGQLASALRLRAEQASQREREARALYRLVSATTNEESLERQLDIVAHAIVESFSADGVRDCAILLPDKAQNLSLLASTQCLPEQAQLTADEVTAAAMVMKQRQIVDVSASHPSVGGSKEAMQEQYVRMFPLKVGTRTVGVVRLLMQDARYEGQRLLGLGQEGANPRNAFFWSFLDQATSIIEHARLRQESLQVELLRRTDELRAALLSSVSHDLRTPLASIKAAASSLLQEDVQWDDEARRSFIVAIEQEADRLNHLVGNLLDMSRIEGGALKPEKEWYPIDELIHDVLGHMQMLLKGRPVHVLLPDDLPPVELDYLQIDQVLTNLLENAVHYTPAGSPIEICAVVRDGDMEVSVADHGPGVAPNDRERIFDKFYSVTSGVRKGIVGSGLGLAVCRGLVEAHGGHIWEENRPGGGAIFRFTLPLSIEEKQIYE